ncbi:hypothetical protein TRFO_04482 [Tritrichomonas foetus]|uniref:Uncharacterized protein n=1 Tax=Tritrichomonas foetus TaxID=1144522 RepID=A0A1J4KFX1_9EUKA|nr:hypothetical protein TRFO_04482 [Tritrichomonas foetus]|eukprot:OHT09922.1 hypothetical protein TRFO_04482 [Tritrichomonas foetus]
MQNPMIKMISSLYRAINRIFIRENWFWTAFAAIRIIGTTIFYLICEYQYSRLLKTACRISSNITNINQATYDPSFNDSFVYLKTDNAMYPLLTDFDFGVQAQTAILRRTVDYCQWLEEGFDSTDKTTRTRRYLKVWIKSPLDSTNFMDARYFNPPNLSYSEKEISKDIEIGLYNVNSRLFRGNKDFSPFVPFKDHMEILPTFNQSFKYIGDGFFYFSFNQTKQFESFDKCTPGDVRIRITLFMPQKLTVVGYLTNMTIDTKIVNNIEMGGARNGFIGAEYLLSSQHQNKWKFAITARIIAILSSMILIVARSTSQKAKIWNFSMFAILVLFVRSLMWNNKFLNPYYWFTILFVLALVYTTREEQYVTFD